MNRMQLPINIELLADQSFQHQIFESIRRQILGGQLKPGARIPSTRNLSEQLGISRNTVVLAYDRLIAEESGLLHEAKMVKVQILIYRRQPDEALKIFKTIEDKIEPGLELSSVYLYLALYSTDGRVTEEYGRKFLNSPQIPEELTGFEYT